MTLQHGYHTPGDNHVCKLLKSLYGLKQVPRNWNDKLCSSLFEFGFMQNMNDYSLFVRNKTISIIVLLVYLDDVLLT